LRGARTIPRSGIKFAACAVVWRSSPTTLQRCGKPSPERLYQQRIAESKGYMRTLEQIRKVLAGRKKELRAKFNVKSIALFGSYVRGDNTPASDLDILIEPAQPMGWEIVDLHDYLQEILGMKVDLVTKGAVSRKQILWKSIQEDLVNV
jgi:predicted nucleotidyltransferase